MPKIKIETMPKPRAVDVDADDDRDAPTTMMGRARDFLSGRAGERREKKRNRAPRNILGRRG